MRSYLILLLGALFMLILNGCDIVQGIFELGVWVGAIMVILIIVVVIWLIKKIFD